MTHRMSDEQPNDLPIKMMVYLTSEINNEQLELLYAYTKQHTLAEFIDHIEVSKQARSLLQTVEGP